MDDTARRALDREPYLSLATFRRSGVAVETAVWFALEGERFYVFTEARSGKVKRLRNDAHVRVAVCDVRGKVRGPWIEGRAQRVEDQATEARAYTALMRKYGWQMRITNFFSRLTGRIQGRCVLEIELSG